LAQVQGMNCDPICCRRIGIRVGASEGQASNAPSALGHSIRCTQSSTCGALPPISAPAVGSVHIS
jgi:hypothetical protein